MTESEALYCDAKRALPEEFETALENKLMDVKKEHIATARSIQEPSSRARTVMESSRKSMLSSRCVPGISQTQQQSRFGAVIPLWRISTTSELYYFLFPISSLSVLAVRAIMNSGIDCELGYS
jgi:hypothetical protein